MARMENHSHIAMLSGCTKEHTQMLNHTCDTCGISLTHSKSLVAHERIQNTQTHTNPHIVRNHKLIDPHEH